MISDGCDFLSNSQALHLKGFVFKMKQLYGHISDKRDSAARLVVIKQQRRSSQPVWTSSVFSVRRVDMNQLKVRYREVNPNLGLPDGHFPAPAPSICLRLSHISTHPPPTCPSPVTFITSPRRTFKPGLNGSLVLSVLQLSLPGSLCEKD